MAGTSSRIIDKTGLPPGALVHVGEVTDVETRITLIDYSKQVLEEKRVYSLDEIQGYRETDTVTWVIVEGLTDIDLIDQIGKSFGVSQLVLEDILHTSQRPKFEDFDDYLFVVLKGLQFGSEEHTVAQEQISLLVFDRIVFSFKEKPDDYFEPVLQRIRTSKGRLRGQGADYLAYVILDTVIDRYFVMMDSLDNTINEMEDRLLSFEANHEVLAEIQNLKRETMIIRRYVSPTRELVQGMLRSESELIHEKTNIYISDVLDHVLRVIESIESQREVLASLMDIYISSVSNKMNETMKVLTVFASIFIPLTFLAGIYGMNFEYMPELKWKWAYPALWVMFLVIPAVLLVYFKRKKWL